MFKQINKYMLSLVLLTSILQIGCSANKAKDTNSNNDYKTASNLQALKLPKNVNVFLDRERYKIPELKSKDITTAAIVPPDYN